MIHIEETLTIGKIEFYADAPIAKIEYLMPFLINIKKKKKSTLPSPQSAILVTWYIAGKLPLLILDN